MERTFHPIPGCRYLLALLFTHFYICVWRLCFPHQRWELGANRNATAHFYHSRALLRCLSGWWSCQRVCPRGRCRMCWSGFRISIPATWARSRGRSSNTPFPVSCGAWGRGIMILTWRLNQSVHVRPAGRALLRLRDHHLERLGLEQLREILQDLLLLRVQEEINELKDLHSGEEAHLFHGDSVTFHIHPSHKSPTCYDWHHHSSRHPAARSQSSSSLLLSRVFFSVTGNKHPQFKAQ